MLERLFDGRLWPVREYDFVSSECGVEWPTDGAIIVVSGDHHAGDVDRINGLIESLEWVLLVVTGDELQKFPIADVSHPNIRLWVQFPRPENEYPGGTRFIPCGFPPDTPDVLDAFSHVRERSLDWFFAGQMDGNDRRAEFAAHIQEVPNGEFVATEGFRQGLPWGEYLIKTRSAKIIPCPSGLGTQDSFRLYEALEAGCVPLNDGHRPLMRGAGFWKLLFGDGNPVQTVFQSWGAGPEYIKELLNDGLRRTNATFAWWQQQKRQMAVDLHDDLVALGARPTVASLGRDDEITVLISCSPIPSHPSTEVLDETIASVRRQLPRAEIIVMFDGVRHEQEDRRDDYEEFVNRALHKCNSEWTNVVPYTFWIHRHQGWMTRYVLAKIATPTILYVEHDTPLVGEIPWNDIVEVVRSRMLNVVRFLFFDEIPVEWDYLMLDPGPVDIMGLPVRRTAQWSQRPHLAATDFYRWMLDRYIGWKSRTYIEDAVYGPCEGGLESRTAWGEWRVAIYHPEGSIKRSGHTDGRADDMKWDPTFAYDGDVPRRAPQPTEGR
jgi:hypothetical protein